MPLTSALLESAESTSAVCDTTSTTDCQRTAASWSCSRSGIQAGEQRRISDDQRESRNANGVALSPTHRPTVGTGQRPSLRPRVGSNCTRERARAPTIAQLIQLRRGDAQQSVSSEMGSQVKPAN